MSWIADDMASNGSAETRLPASNVPTNCAAPNESLQAQHEQVAYNDIPFPIAIVGMAMRLPGGVDTTEKLWEMLITKKDGHCEVPASRYNVDAFYNATRPGTVKTRHGYFLQDDIGHIDRSFFSMSKTEAAKLDPQQRLLLEVVWECMVSGGQKDWRGQNIGCFVGVFGEDWLEMSSKDPQYMDRYHVVSAGDFALSNRVSYEYDLQGPRSVVPMNMSQIAWFLTHV
jgi:acyl transferase domain-containing protein